MCLGQNRATHRSPPIGTFRIPLFYRPAKTSVFFFSLHFGLVGGLVACLAVVYLAAVTRVVLKRVFSPLKRNHGEQGKPGILYNAIPENCRTLVFFRIPGQDVR